VGCCAGVAFSARSVLSVADIIYDPLIFDLINEPVIIVTIVLTQPLDRLVFRVRISQFYPAARSRACDSAAIFGAKTNSLGPSSRIGGSYHCARGRAGNCRNTWCS
jgi:hypothetical protein